MSMRYFNKQTLLCNALKKIEMHSLRLPEIKQVTVGGRTWNCWVQVKKTQVLVFTNNSNNFQWITNICFDYIFGRWE